MLGDEPLAAAAIAVAVSDWPATVARAERERVAPLLYSALRLTAPGSSAPPSWVIARLRSAWVAAERQHLLAGIQLRDAVHVLGRAGIQAIVLKGPALATAYYPDPALRPFTDLDLLVRRSDRERALEILSTIGYAHASPGRSLPYELEHAPAAYLVASHAASFLPLDLHWECVAHPGGSPATAVALDEIWDRAAPAAEWGETAHILAPEDLVVYLAAHFAIHHSLAGLLWQLDLALVLRRHAATLDWQAVADRARRWCVAHAVYFALRSVRAQLGVAASDAVMRCLSPRAFRVALIDRLQGAGPERLLRLEYLIGLMMLDRRADVVRTLASGLVPRPRWLRSRYESRSLLAAYAAHYGRLVRIATRALHQ